MTQSTLSADLEDERPSSEEVVAALIRRGRTAMDGLTGARFREHSGPPNAWKITNFRVC